MPTRYEALLVSVGVDFGDLEIRATLAEGLKAAFARRGLAVVAGCWT